MAKFNFASLEKKESKDEITPEDNNQKVVHVQYKKASKPNLKPKKLKTQINRSVDLNMIDNKINGIVNDRILKLVKLGLKHELTIENMIQYFKETKRLKLYNLTRYFSDAKPSEIENILKYLYNTEKLRKDKNGWYWLK
jgi:hypothetical protein